MKKVLSLIMILFVLSTSFLVACKDEQPQVFIKDGVIELYTEKELDLSGILTEEYTIACEESDVLSITEKTIFAKKVGKATVTMETEDIKYFQEIHVVDYGNHPEVLIDDVALTVGASYKLQPKTTFNLNNLDGVTYNYSIENASVAEIKDGKIIAKSLGQTNVTVTANYNGVNGFATKKFVCKVNELSGIEMNRGYFELFVRPDVDGNLFDAVLDVEADVYVSGQKVENAEVQWQIADSTIASLSGNQISAVKVGTTTLKGTYTGADGKVLSTKELTVDVKIPIVEVENPQLMDLGSSVQLFESANVFVDQTQQISYMLIGDKEYVLTNNALETAGFTAGEYDCVFYNTDKTYGYKTQLVIADFVVYTASQLEYMADHPNEYIAIANDIDYGEYYGARPHLQERYHNQKGLFVSPQRPIYDVNNPIKAQPVLAFNGTLNGMGHNISNINFYGSGLFPTCQDCMVKNLAFVNATFTDYNSACLGYTCIGRTYIDNVYVDGYCTSGTYEAGLFEEVHRAGALYITNSIVKVGIKTNDENIRLSAANNTGVIVCRLTGTVEVENSYFFSETQQLCSLVAHTNNVNYKFLNMLNCLYRNEEEFQMELNNEDGIVDYSGFNGYWDFSSVIPQFKSINK